MERYTEANRVGNGRLRFATISYSRVQHAMVRYDI